MKKNTTAVFYDGNSSVPQQVNLLLDFQTSAIRFESANGENHNWFIHKITFDKRATGLHLDYGTDLIQHIKIEDVDFINAIQLFRKEIVMTKTKSQTPMKMA